MLKTCAKLGDKVGIKAVQKITVIHNLKQTVQSLVQKCGILHKQNVVFNTFPTTCAQRFSTNFNLLAATIYPLSTPPTTTTTIYINKEGF